ncbi:hypothetical protein EJB05_35091, partial [Eragrostis curvula]
MLLPCGLQEASPCPAKVFQPPDSLPARTTLAHLALPPEGARPVAGRRPWLRFSCAHESRPAAAVPCLPFLFTVTVPRSPPSSSLPLASRRSVRTVALGQRFGASQLPVLSVRFSSASASASDSSVELRRHAFGFLMRGGATEAWIWFGPESSFDLYADLVRF